MYNKLFLGMIAATLSMLLVAGCGKKEETAPAQPVAPPPAGQVDTAAEPEPEAEEERTYDLRKRLVDATSQQDEWVPELTPTPVASVGETVARADAALRAGRTHEGENSALTLYLSVLETDPENAEAIAGVDKVVAALVERGEKALAENRFNEAARLLPVVTRMRPDDPGVVALKGKIDSGREVAALLAEAQRLAQQGRVVEPEGDNAAAIYRSILRSDADNQAAQQGLARLESDLIARATTAAEAGNYAESDRLLADAGKVRPGSQSVQNASTRIVEMRQGRAGQIIEQADAAIEARDFARAEQMISDLERTSAQAQGVQELRTRLTSARSYASLRPGQVLTDPLRSGGNAPEVVVIPVGSFRMGSPANEADRKANEGPQFEVTIRNGFAIGRTEVTMGQFRAFVNATRYTTSAQRNGSSSIYDEKSGSMADKGGVTWQDGYDGRRSSPERPVIHVSWDDAKAYAEWLTRETGKAYRLPSEAEFEYVLRAGTQTRYPWGDGNPTRVVGNFTGDGDRSGSRRNWVNAFANYSDGHWGPAPVASYEANRFGIHDMNGNVSEWIEDCWHDNYQRAPTDGSAWVNPGCGRRVLRGASWASAPDQVRSAFRLNAAPNATNPRLGFRVARDL